MTRSPCKWLRKTNLGCFCVCQVFFTRKSFVDESHCLGCTVYEPSSVCPTCKHYDNSTDTEEEFCHALGEVIGDTAMGNSKITNCEYWCEDNLTPLNWETATRLPCEYLGFNYSQQCCICRYDVKKSIELPDLKRCFDCKNYIAVFKSHVKPKELTPMIICKYQNEKNDCTKSSQRTFACVFARCNAWDAAEARCQYFEHTHELGMQNLLANIPTARLEFLERMIKDDTPWTMKQISLSLSSRYDP